MGLLDPFTDGLSVGPGGFSRPASHRRQSSRSRHKKRRSRSRSRSSSRRRGGTSIAGSLLGGLGDSHYSKHNASRGSFFGLGDSHYSKHNASRGSFFGLGNSSRSSFFGLGGRSSYYKRSPRQGFMQRAYKRLKRMIRDLIHYAKRHPWKVFFLVLMPLVTGGALTALLARFGLRMPPSLERMLGVASRAASGDGFGVVSEAVRMAGDFGSGGARVERGRDGGLQWERRSTYGPGHGNDGWGDSIKGVAKMFI
ncbi:putative protein Pop3 [Purpureocillium lavendulum]|uniref:Uncharacterized protein n=1 Tax=Purpureocillium lavendulum TaxID=1247861 RepID=A0AB34G3S4_9HYPO|nr:putative protein Pop3 [Purpureocillium lavendulum]